MQKHIRECLCGFKRGPRLGARFWVKEDFIKKKGRE
jgi:hypothetical protein